MKTFGSVLDDNKGLGPGFDFLRLFLAVSIVFFHSLILTGNVWIRHSPLWFMEYALVPCFFALSGYLVTASGLRLSLRNFLINRALRIVPALGVDILFCTLIMGVIFTTLPLTEYFQGTSFYLYYLNIFGYIHYLLPGTFENHPDNYVNGALWTVPYEIFCYFIICVLMLKDYLRDVRKISALTIFMVLAGLFLEYTPLLDHMRWRIRITAHFLFIDRESQIVTAFLCGVIVYHLRYRVRYDLKIFLLASAVCLATSFMFDEKETADVLGRLVLLPALTYMTVFIGLTKIQLPAFIKHGDYSYGIYLYHDPILQGVISLFPAFAVPIFASGVQVFLLGLPFVVLMAGCSWHFVEKPILKLRRKFSFVARVRDT